MYMLLRKHVHVFITNTRFVLLYIYPDALTRFFQHLYIHPQEFLQNFTPYLKPLEVTRLIL